MKHDLLIVGDTGTGKSTSIKTLDPQKTFIIRLVNKNLPWRASASIYSTEKRNLVNVTTWAEVVQLLEGISKGRPEVTTIVIDDFNYMLSREYFNRASEAGFGKFTEIGQHAISVLETAKSLRSDLSVVFLMQEQIEVDNAGIRTKKPRTVGNILDASFNIAGLFETVLYTDVTFEDEKPLYQFVTNKTETTPAKSPDGMFKEYKVPNDLSSVLATMDDYYTNLS